MWNDLSEIFSTDTITFSSTFSTPLEFEPWANLFTARRPSNVQDTESEAWEN